MRTVNETLEEKVTRLEREKRKLEREAEENMMIGFVLGRGPGTRATRMYATEMIAGDW